MSYSMSIIIPVYNCEDYIRRGIDSIVNQTFPFNELEIIIINDNSTDSSLKILKEYDGEFDNIVLINLEKNHGNTSYPRNLWIEHSSADYIMFMDIDDFYEVKACEILFENAIKHDSDIVSGRFYKLYDNIKVKPAEPEKNFFIKDITENPELLGQTLFLWNKIFKKSFLERNNIKFTESGVGDIVFTSQCFLLAKNLLFLKDAYVYTKFINSDSISTNKTGKYFNYYLKGCYKAHDIFEENNSLHYFKYFVKNRINHLFNVITNTELNNEKKIELLKKLKELIDIASSEGTEFDDRINLIMYLLNLEEFDYIFYLMRYTKISKKRQIDKKILKSKTLILKDKNKILKNKISILKDKNKILKNKIKDLRELLILKNYIRFKLVNILNKIK